jgi:hypothetical protein
MKNPSYLLASDIVVKAYKDKTIIPDHIKAAFMLHRQSSYFGKKVSLMDLVIQGIVTQAIVENKIRVKGVTVIEGCPIKNMLLYRHEFVTPNGLSFYTFELGNFPNSSLDCLSNSVLEFFVDSGCVNCGYGSLDEEDLNCPICLSGEVRKKVRSTEGYISFPQQWQTFVEAVGPEISHMLLDLASFNYKSYVSKEAKAKIAEYVGDYKKLFGSYLGDGEMVLYSPPSIAWTLQELVDAKAEDLEDDEEYEEDQELDDDSSEEDEAA